MVWRVGARVHALLHGLLRPREVELVRRQWNELAGQFRQAGIGDDDDRARLVALIAEDVARHLSVPSGHAHAARIHEFVHTVFDYEGLFVLPVVDWSRPRTIAELWDIRGEITRQRALVGEFDDKCALLRAACIGFLEPLYDACPALLAETTDGISVPTSLLRSVGDLGVVVGIMLGAAFAEELAESGLCSRLADRLERNLVAASGGNPADPRSFNRAPKLPPQFDAKAPEQLVAAYLGGTPLWPLFNQPHTFTIPTKARFEHHHIVAGSGHGKTQTLQYLIAGDLPAVAAGQRSVIVLDSQGDLIRTIASLKAFGQRDLPVNGSVKHERHGQSCMRLSRTGQ